MGTCCFFLEEIILSVAIHLETMHRSKRSAGRKSFEDDKIVEGKTKLVGRSKIATDGWNIATDLVNNASLLIFIAVYLLKSAASEKYVRRDVAPPSSLLSFSLGEEARLSKSPSDFQFHRYSSKRKSMRNGI